MIPEISVIIPTHNRPRLVERAVRSVLDQTYRGEIEIIIVDVGLDQRADTVANLDDSHILYIKSPEEKNGSEARNIGIRRARGAYVAFLDDDDEWLSEKLEVQMGRLKDAPMDVGYSFTSVINIYNDHEVATHVPDGVDHYFNLMREYFKAFLTVTLIIRREVFDIVGLFDERFLSHQETDLMMRVTKRYRGLGINAPLTRVTMNLRDHIGGDCEKRIRGRTMLLAKYANDFAEVPSSLAGHLFDLGVMHRDSGHHSKARGYFKKAWQTYFKPRYIIHWLSMMFDGILYRFLKEEENPKS